MRSVIIFLTLLVASSYARFFKPSGEKLLDGSCQARETRRIKNCMAMYPPMQGEVLVTKWLFNEVLAKCEPFKASFYCGNKHGLDTELDCINSCACEIPPDAGHDNGVNCKPETRYSFNQRMETCQPFQYHGCGGNGNNFKNVSQCMRMCNPRDLGSSDFFHMMNMMRFGGRGGAFQGGFNNGFNPNPYPTTPPPRPQNRFNTFHSRQNRNRNNFGQGRQNRFNRQRQQRPSWRQNRRPQQQQQQPQNRKPYNPLRDILPPGQW